MKEIIIHSTARLNGHIVLTALAGTTITVNNILGIINKTTGKVLYTPLKFGTISLNTVSLSDGTYQEIIFGSSIPTQPANSEFFIKLYVDQASDLVADFFGIVETPDEEVMSETEAIGILEDTWLAVTGSAAPHTDDWDGSGSGSGSGSES